MKILSTFLMTAMMVTLFGCRGSAVSSTSPEDTSSGSEEVLTSEEASGSNESSASKEVTIGKHVWMTENLNVDKFRNGDPIPQAKTAEEWAKAAKNGEPAWCYYDNDPANGEKYGKLYNFYAVNDPRGLSPGGWHIPSDAEWLETINHLGGENEAGIKMKDTSGWFENGNGTDQSGFKGFPSGVRGDNGDFTSLGKNGFWWSSTETEKQNKKIVWIFYLDYSFKWVIKEVALKGSGLAVRCVKD